MKNLKSKIMFPIHAIGYFACSLISRVALKIGNATGKKTSDMLSKMEAATYF